MRVALVFEANDAEAVRGHVDRLPMVLEGLFDIDMMQLGPWRPFAVLFGPQAGS